MPAWGPPDHRAAATCSTGGPRACRGRGEPRRATPGRAHVSAAHGKAARAPPPLGHVRPVPGRRETRAPGARHPRLRRPAHREPRCHRGVSRPQTAVQVRRADQTSKGPARSSSKPGEGRRRKGLERPRPCPKARRRADEGGRGRSHLSLVLNRTGGSGRDGGACCAAGGVSSMGRRGPSPRKGPERHVLRDAIARNRPPCRTQKETWAESLPAERNSQERRLGHIFMDLR